MNKITAGTVICKPGRGDSIGGNEMNDAEKIARLEKALWDIINQQPCTNNGECFRPHYDMDGNYLGEQEVNPVAVIGDMTAIARTALDEISNTLEATNG